MILSFLKLLPLLLVGACASDQYVETHGHTLFRRGEYAYAEEAFAQEGQKPGPNQFLYLVDAGMSAFRSAQYKKAIEHFLKAEKIAEIKDYTSISEEVGVLATGEAIRGYKGEDFEKVLVNVYLAMSYCALNEYEEARVEARKINQLLYRMIHEGKRNYQESPMARYLSAMLWEAEGNVDSAYIDYKNTYDLDPNFPGLSQDLLALSRKADRWDDLARWRKEFSGQVERAFARNEGEVIVFWQKGLSPIKVPRNDDSSLPRFSNRIAEYTHAFLEVEGKSYEFNKVLDIESLSDRYLEDRISRLRLARLAGAAVKGVAGWVVSQASKNEDLGWLAFFILLASDQADLRSWRTLPSEVQMLRVPLKEGTHQLKVKLRGRSGEVTQMREFQNVIVKAGKKNFLIVP